MKNNTPGRPDSQFHESRFDNLPPQLMSDVTAGDYVNILKEARWNNDFKAKATVTFLGASSIHDVVYYTHKCSIAASLVLRYVLPEYLESRGFVIERVASLESDGEYAASYSAIEIAPNKNVECLDYGAYFVTGENAKYIINLEDYTVDSYLFKFASLKSADPNSNNLIEGLLKYADEHNFLRGQKIDPNCKFVKFNNKLTWDDLILSDKIKTEIKMNLKNLIEYRDIYKNNGLQIKRGLILAGAPGVGKTLLAKILCNTIDWTFIWVTSKNLENPKRVAHIVGMARDLSPAIIFLEDIDLFGGSREFNANPMMLGELLNQLDGIEENSDIIIIGSTNNKEVLEKALVSRPGRFDKVIDFPLPAVPERIKMIETFSNGLLGDNVPYLEEVAKDAKKKTGAQIRELVNMAIIFAIDEKSYDAAHKLIITHEHFKSAMKSIENKDFTKLTGFSTGDSSTAAADPFDDFND
jgi:cell division protease FtsH